MNTQEIQEQLQDNQELTIKLGERMTSAEEILDKLMDIKDYSGQLDKLKELIIKIAEQDKTAPILEQISQQVNVTEQLASTVEQVIGHLESLVINFPKERKVKLQHQFEDKTKAFIIGGITLLILSALAIDICLHLWSENGRMRDNDIKFRIVRQIAPNTAYRADTLYYPDPEGIEKKTKQLEAEHLAYTEADVIAKQKEKEAIQAKKKARKIKKSKIVL